MKNLKDNILFKVSAIGILILILLIPSSMVKDLITERQRIQEGAIAEVSSKWASRQAINGPILSIPYDRYIKKLSVKDSTEKIVKIREWVHFLPELLEVNGEVFPKKRHRGIYEVVVYNSQLNIKGFFPPINIDGLDIPREHFHPELARLNVGLGDLKGIEEQVVLHWNQEQHDFNSGVEPDDLISVGINADVAVKHNDSLRYNFEVALELKGSQNIYFSPVGKTTKVSLSSPWQTPSFDGQFLPDTQRVDNEGFQAEWKVLHLNRNFPQKWKGTDFSVRNDLFGTELILPTDNYRRSYRVAKYASLFLVITFLVFFFVEVLKKIYIHPIQYLLVGVAIIVFYSLLLSFSEHIVFNWSYAIASVLTLGLISLYTRSILKSKPLAWMLCGILAIMYGFIFSILQMEDYALLIGSLGVFVILATVMYFSRKIDWYALNDKMDS